ncbi:MAG: helix-turn-helix domain-containing protein, partial [Acidimicrobiales bacterium]
GQLHALLRTARAATGITSEIGPGGAPVGDLFALANAVASMVGGATTIEDTHSTVLAYSSTDEPIDEPRRQTILGRRVPESWRARLERDGVFRRLWSEGFVRVDYSDTDPGFCPRTAVAIRAGGELLGSIWVAEGHKPMREEAEAALREAGDMAALHLLRHRAGEDIERRRRAELLRSVLDGRMPVDVLAGSRGISASSAVTVIAFELHVDPTAPIADQTLLADRAVNLITAHCEAYRRQATLVAEGTVVYVLLADQTPPDARRLASLASAVVQQLSDVLRVPARAGIGPTGPPAAVLESRQDADRVLHVLAGGGGLPVVARVDDVRSRAVLVELRDLAARQPHLMLGKLDRLVDHDGEGRSAYVETLRAYLDAFGDVATAAANVNVHPNTFRYRLRRLLELADIDLDDPIERLVTHLQLTLLDTGEAAT